MPSNKILTIFILCFGVVVSVWFVTNKQKSLSQKITPKKDSVEIAPTVAIKNTDYDWKKILTESNKTNSKVTDLTKTVTIPEEGTTLTDQMSRDILSQYLIVAKNGSGFTPDIASKIVDNTLSLPDYQPSSVVYIKENLKITSKSDPITVKKYKDRINQILIPVYYNVKDDPMAIMINSLQSDSEKELKKIDPIIAINKTAIKSLLDTEVPEIALEVHLNLLNASSLLLSDLESMRVAVSDPARIFTVLGSYTQHMVNFGTSVTTMDEFLLKKSAINLF